MATELSNASNFVVERAKPADALAIATIKRKAWLAAYVNRAAHISQQDIERLYPASTLQIAERNWHDGILSESHQNEKATFVARLDNQVVGFTSPETIDGEKRVGQLYVDPNNHSRGIGSELLTKALQWHGKANDIYLHVVQYNALAIRFYERHGFIVTGKEFPAEYDADNKVKLLPEAEMVLSRSTIQF